MTITSMPEVLRWGDRVNVFEQVHEAHLNLLAQKMGETLAEISRQHPSLAESLLPIVNQVSDDSFMRVLIAPETCSHLLGRQDAHITAQFIRNSFLAEALREGKPQAIDQEIWTALGDAGFAPDGSKYQWPQVQGMMPLDYGSPHATKVDLSGADRETVPARPPFSTTEILRVDSLLRDVCSRLISTNVHIANFVSDFNKVLVLQKDAESPHLFASGSNGYFIGRSFLANPHLPQVCEVNIADAIVHEGIHALLYMQEQQDPWFLDPTLKRSFPRVASAWTGSSLTLASFLQACFVWYGLLHFWSLALAADTFDREMALERIKLSLRGFLGKPLRDHVSSYLSMINECVLTALDEMQSTVTSAFSLVTASASQPT